MRILILSSFNIKSFNRLYGKGKQAKIELELELFKFGAFREVTFILPGKKSRKKDKELSLHLLKLKKQTNINE